MESISNISIVEFKKAAVCGSGASAGRAGLNEAAAMRGIRLYSSKVDLVPHWVTEQLSSNPYFDGDMPDAA